jgi:NAD+ kinase
VTDRQRSVDRVGVVVHPSRNIDDPLNRLLTWARGRGVDVVQIEVPGQHRVVARPGEVSACDVIVSIGGDGTMLAAIRGGVAAGLPVLGVSCGSLGVLTAVTASALPAALDRFGAGDWTPRALPALGVACPGAPDLFALNDLGIVRNGIGQVRVTTWVDGVLYSRLAGDGCIVSTALGSSAYSLAAGGPLLTPGTDAYVLTPLPTHGGSKQALVLAARSELALEVTAGMGGSRLEIDGQLAATDPSSLTIRLRPDVATLVAFVDDEPLLTSLRRRGIIADSPRIVADAARTAPVPATERA